MTAPPLRNARTIEIRWPDMDGLGHVNNAVFLTYLEAARDAFLAVVCEEEPERLECFVVRRIELDYLAAATLDDGHVRVEVEFAGLGTTSLRTLETMRAASDGRELAVARAVMVHLDATRSRPEPIPDHLRARLGAA